MRDDVAQGSTVVCRLATFGANGGQLFSHSTGSAEQEVAGATGRIDDVDGENRLLFFFLGGLARKPIDHDRIKRRIKELLYQAVRGVVAA
jgi:hypothetical protein